MSPIIATNNTFIQFVVEKGKDNNNLTIFSGLHSSRMTGVNLVPSLSGLMSMPFRSSIEKICAKLSLKYTGSS